ncbi:hypothetical protein BBF93_05945 [Hyphomonas sp. CACIAM 19H1]|nr:hypothetical protein BBF93_05945 [Hyphomonas sp. CACIAM 19H1]
MRLPAGFDDAREGSVKADPERVLADPALQAFGNVERVQGQDAPEVRVDKEQPRVIPRVGHGKNAPAVAGMQVFRAEAGGHQIKIWVAPR